jgi:N-acylneuraminate cytidylyltransferase
VKAFHPKCGSVEKSRLDMIAGLSVQAVITARGGSRRLPRKNVLPLAGLPLIAWTIRAAQAATLIDDLILSSDDAEIRDVSSALGCRIPFVRPSELASDAARSIDVLRHAIGAQTRTFDITVCLQPTSPLRTAEDIDGAVRLCIESGAPTCASVTDVSKQQRLVYGLSGDRRLRRITGSVDAGARSFMLNGAVYVARTEWLKTGELIGPETVAWVMPSHRSIDIDEHLDFRIAEMLLAEREGAPVG